METVTCAPLLLHSVLMAGSTTQAGSEKIPWLAIGNPTDERFQKNVGQHGLENYSKNWGKYFDAAKQWIMERFHELEIIEVIGEGYGEIWILKECSADTAVRIREVLENDEQNPYGFRFGRSTKEATDTW